LLLKLSDKQNQLISSLIAKEGRLTAFIKQIQDESLSNTTRLLLFLLVRVMFESVIAVDSETIEALLDLMSLANSEDSALKQVGV
jgi:hypothetical protein